MENSISLRDALSVLAKSSPEAVEVERDEGSQNIYKQYLYIETQIEKDFSERLSQIKPGDIIFLCGSSGDGKSEILTRYSSLYDKYIEFHLDATHSFEPKKTAIETLNERFTKHKESDKALVVGINIGMLAKIAI